MNIKTIAVVALAAILVACLVPIAETDAVYSNVDGDPVVGTGDDAEYTITYTNHDYDDADTTRMYCCELVSAAFRAAGTDIAPLPRHSVSLPGLRLDSVMLPSDFRRSPALRVVAEFP